MWNQDSTCSALIPRSISNLPAHGCQIKDDGSVATGRTAIGTKEIKGIQIEIIQMSVLYI